MPGLLTPTPSTGIGASAIRSASRVSIATSASSPTVAGISTPERATTLPSRSVTTPTNEPLFDRSSPTMLWPVRLMSSIVAGLPGRDAVRVPSSTTRSSSMRSLTTSDIVTRLRPMSRARSARDRPRPRYSACNTSARLCPRASRGPMRGAVRSGLSRRMTGAVGVESSATSVSKDNKQNAIKSGSAAVTQLSCGRLGPADRRATPARPGSTAFSAARVRDPGPLPPRSDSSPHGMALRTRTTKARCLRTGPS